MPKQAMVRIKRRQLLGSRGNKQAAKEAEVAVLFLKRLQKIYGVHEKSWPNFPQTVLDRIPHEKF